VSTVEQERWNARVRGGSPMTLFEIVESGLSEHPPAHFADLGLYANLLIGDGPLSQATDARAALVEFLGGEEGDEPVISSEVRIILISANFSRELMTTVLWLNRFEGLDIRCVQLVPYRIGERVLIDVRQIVPLPEASDYEIRVRRKEQQQERAQRDNRDRTRYHIILDGQEQPSTSKRQAMRLFVTNLVDRGVSVDQIKPLLHPRCFRSVEGRYEDGVAVKAAFAAADPRFDAPRWWCEYPLVEENATWLLTSMWGAETESSLAALAQAFPGAGVAYRAA
jgi:hypothetical protein